MKNKGCNGPEGEQRTKKARVASSSAPVWFGKDEEPAEAEEDAYSYYSDSPAVARQPPAGEKKKKKRSSRGQSEDRSPIAERSKEGYIPGSLAGNGKGCEEVGATGWWLPKCPATGANKITGESD